MKAIQKPQLRSSSLPLFMACSNAVLNPDGLVPVETDIAEITMPGTLVHKLAEDYVNTGSYDIEPLRQRLPVEDFDRAGKLMRNFMDIWQAAKPYMAKAVTELYIEAEFDAFVLTGHLDLVNIAPTRAFIIDYKTGRQHEDHFHQMAGYAYLAWTYAGKPKVFTANVSVAYLEDKSVHPYSFDVPALREWAAEVSAQEKNLRYTVGRKCSGCGLRDSCPAYRQFMAGATVVFNDDTAIPQKSWEDMTPAQRGELVDRMYVIEKAIDRAKLGLRNLVKQKGRVDIGDGKQMVLVEEQNMFLDTRKSLPILKKNLPQAEIDRVARLPLDDVLTAFAKRAAKGQKTKAREELLGKLDKAGAVVRYGSTRMWRRPADEKILE